MEVLNIRKAIISLVIVALTTSFAFAAPKGGTGNEPASIVQVATFTEEGVGNANFETEVLLLDEKVNSFLTANQITDVISITNVIFGDTSEYTTRALIRTVTYRE